MEKESSVCTFCINTCQKKLVSQEKARQVAESNNFRFFFLKMMSKTNMVYLSGVAFFFKFSFFFFPFLSKNIKNSKLPSNTVTSSWTHDCYSQEILSNNDKLKDQSSGN